MPEIIVILILVKLFRRSKKKKQVASVDDQLRQFLDSQQSEETFELATTREDNTIIRLYNVFRGVLITGGAGSGKSKSIIEPFISEAVRNGFSGVLYDYKYPELTNKLIGISIANDPNIPIGVNVVNFDDLSRTRRINPLDSQLMPKSIYAREYAKAIVANLIPESIKNKDFWSRSSENLLSAVIWFLASEFPQYSSLPHVVSMLLTEDLERLIAVLSTNPECEGMVMSIKSGMKSDNQTAGVLGTLQGAISQLNTPDLFYVMTTPEDSDCNTTVNVNDSSNPQFLTIGNNPSLQEAYTPAISLIITACLKQMNQPNKHKSILLMDETPTCFIPNLENIPAVSRSNKLATVLCMQDISQLEQKYGEKNSEVLISNLANHFYGRVTNPKTAERYSKTFGKVDRTYTTNSKNQQGLLKSSTGTSQSIQQRELYPPQDFLNLSPGKFIGHLADSDYKTFSLKFKEQHYPSGNFAPFDMAENEPQRTYKQVKSDVKFILE